MATAQSDMHDDLHEMITCTVCLEKYTQPRQLPCLHVFCLKCVQGLIQPEDNTGKIPCPVCREEAAVPPAGSQDFPVSFFMNSLCETVGKFEACQDSPCSFCAEDGEDSPGTWLCLQCFKAMCTVCKKHHMRHLKHDVIEYTTISKTSMQDIFRKRSQKCAVHQQKDIEFFCETCEVLLCLSCFVNKHKGINCNTKELADVFATYQEKLGNQKSKLGEVTEQCNKYIITTESILAGSCQKFQSAVDDVKERANAMRELIDEFEETMISELQKKQQEVEGGYMVFVKDIKDRQRQVKEYKDSLESVSTCGTYVDLVKTLDSGKERYESVTSPVVNSTVEEFDISTHFPDDDDVKYAFGHIVLASKFSEFDIPHHARGSALTPDGNMVICGLRKNWAASYKPNGELASTFQLAENARTWDVACSQDNVCISDCNGQIYVCNFDGTVESCINTVTVGFQGDLSLSVNNDLLYVASFRKDQIKTCSLESQSENMWSDLKTPALAGPADIKSTSELLLVANNTGHYVSGYDSKAELKFVIKTDKPIPVDSDQEGHIFIKSSRAVALYTSGGNYIGNIKTKRTRAIVCLKTGPGRTLYCGVDLSDDVHKIVCYKYQII